MLGDGFLDVVGWQGGGREEGGFAAAGGYDMQLEYIKSVFRSSRTYKMQRFGCAQSPQSRTLRRDVFRESCLWDSVWALKLEL